MLNNQQCQLIIDNLDNYDKLCDVCADIHYEFETRYVNDDCEYNEDTLYKFKDLYESITDQTGWRDVDEWKEAVKIMLQDGR